MIIENPKRDEWQKLILRPELQASGLMGLITEVFDEVKYRGDEALKDYSKKFDGVELSSFLVEDLRVNVKEDLKKAIQTASKNIFTFHESQKLTKKEVETTPGVICWQESRPLDSVGLYIPGGTAPLFSSVLMLAIPAKIAGCSEIVLCTPPDKQGNVNDAILYAAQVAGITKVYRVGGAQAIAAMTLGTSSIPKVDKIFGPGNQYVTAAKKFASNVGTPIDMPAGPSELLVIASENSIPRYVAADLLSQAEHGSDSQVICLALSTEKLNQIRKELATQIKSLPRKEIASNAMDNSKFIVLEDSESIIDFTNLYAPEHLIIADDAFEKYIPKIINAGSVFLGNYCPESAGDYASGTNHTLPTSGYAKIYSGVNLDDFIKKITFQKITKEGISNLGRTIEVMAEAEGLHAHKNAVSIRLADLKS